MSDWESHEQALAASTTPEQRLAWLEQTKRFVHEFLGKAQTQGARVSSAETAAHYTWGDGCEGWRLLDLPSLAVTQERMPGGTREARHYHAKARQFFFVLRGTLTIEIEGKVHAVEPERGLEISPSLAHEVRNDSASTAEFLVVATPSTEGDRVLV